MAIGTMKTGKFAKSRVSGSKAVKTPKAAALSRPATKNADSKGRVALGSRFANRAVIVEAISDTEMLIKLARVIPEKEAWLYENTSALNAVRKGLAQAHAGELIDGPDIDSDEKLTSQLED